MEVEIQVYVFGVVTPCSVVAGYHCFGGPCCLHLHPDNGGSKVLRNFSILSHNYMASQPRGPQLQLNKQFKYFLPWSFVMNCFIVYICACQCYASVWPRFLP